MQGSVYPGCSHLIALTYELEPPVNFGGSHLGVNIIFGLYYKNDLIFNK